MWFFETVRSRLPHARNIRWLTIAMAIVTLSACTIEPLNANRTARADLAGGSVRSILAQTEVDPVTTRYAQQVRNGLLFEFNGGQLQPGGQYRVKLNVSRRVQRLAVESNSRAPTSSQVLMRVQYALIDKEAGKTIATGKRQTIAAFDRTPQSFANERAERDAENRAAVKLARQIHLAVAQTLSNL